MRIIIHLDMDCFFAQVEEKDNPVIKGKPVIVGADPKKGKGRGVGCTCNYEARKLGIKSAMPISKAWQLCPSGIFLLPNFERYEEESCKVMSIASKYADLQNSNTKPDNRNSDLQENAKPARLFQQVSIDEAYIDVSSSGSYEKARAVAAEIKQEILSKTKLTCSIGIGPNMLIAKLAANENKPDGLTLVLPENIREYLAPKPVRALFGIGPKTAERLKENGLTKVQDLVIAGKEKLQTLFGKWGEQLWLYSQGIDDRDFEFDEVCKSIGREITFGKDVADEKRIRDVLDELVADVFSRLMRQKLMFKTITLKLRYENYETRTKSKSVHGFTQNIKILRSTIQDHANGFLIKNRKIRLLGVSVSNLESIKNREDNEKPCRQTLLYFMEKQDSSQQNKKSTAYSESWEMQNPSSHLSHPESYRFRPHLNQGL